MVRTFIQTGMVSKPAAPHSECHSIRYYAGFKAFQTSNALSATNIFRDAGNTNRAFCLATIAMRAAITIDNHPQGGNLIEYNEHCTQWAEVFTPEAFHKQRCDDKDE